jgi:predicted permease
MLLAVVGIVLAIAIANVAVLLLSRATTRARELGVRTAMGAGRGRLARQLLAETLVIAAMGGAVGVGLAYAFSDAAASLLPYAFAGSFAPDARVLGAALALSLVTALLCGLAPALHAARGGIATALEGARTAGGRSRVRDGLVVGQVLLSLVLVAGAVLFARSFLTAHSQDLGFATDDRLVLEVDLRALGYSEEEGRVFIPRALERLRALPGVTAAASSRQIPFQGDWSTDMDPPPGARANTEDGKVWIGLNAVSDGYFDVMGMSIVRGRALDAQDGQGGAPSIVVNETLADLLWPGREALGESLPLRDGVDFAVVGVVRDAVYYELGEEPTTQLYGSVQQVYMSSMSFVIHTAGRATELAAPAQAALREIEPALAFSQVTTLEAIFEEVTARYRVTALLVGLFGALALALAAAGLYGVVSFLVAQRTREIGVRMALGANRARVAGDILRRGMGLTLIGVALGLGATVALRGLTASLLYGIEPADPWAPLLASLVLLGVAALATLAPARRASRIDPMEAIRTE